MSKTATTTATPEEVAELREKVSIMDGYSQEGFGQIAALSSLALGSMEDPDAYLENVARALQTINYIAHDIENLINTEAESVGCQYVDEAERRRWKAQSKRKEGGAA